MPVENKNLEKFYHKFSFIILICMEKKNIEILQGQFKIRLFTLCMLYPVLVSCLIILSYYPVLLSCLIILSYYPVLYPVLVLENGSVKGLEMNSCVMN